MPGNVVYTSNMTVGIDPSTAESEEMAENEKTELQTGSNVLIRPMTIADYEEVHALWHTIQGFGIRSIDDSRDVIERFIRRNPETSVVAVKNGRIVGSILCGNDGRQGSLYHVCVAQDCRRQNIGTQMVAYCMTVLRKMGISKVTLIAFSDNDIGNAFWKHNGWRQADEVNYYDFVLNKENITNFIRGES